MSSRSAMPLLLPLLLAAGACDRQAPSAAQGNAAGDTANAPDEVPPTAAGAITAGAPDRSHRGTAAPTVSFEDPAGKPVTLAAFRGKPVLVNLWATWCAPCIKELPTLDALAAGPVKVIAVSQDSDAAKAAPFLASKGLARLSAYRDPKLGLSLALAANLPTTVLYDAAGKEVWRVTGERDWASAESRALLVEGS